MSPSIQPWSMTTTPKLGPESRCVVPSGKVGLTMTQDTGLGVRKRVIKLLKTIYLTRLEMPLRIDICTKLVSLMGDEDETVKVSQLRVQLGPRLITRILLARPLLSSGFPLPPLVPSAPRRPVRTRQRLYSLYRLAFEKRALSCTRYSDRQVATSQ